MQYLMTEDEMQNVVPKSLLDLSKMALVRAREKILKIAKFDCIHDPNGKNARGQGYCGDCPCGGPMNAWANEWNVVCDLEKKYSK